jgi:hypothetical protein
MTSSDWLSYRQTFNPDARITDVFDETDFDDEDDIATVNGLQAALDAKLNATAAYVLPNATDSILGGIKVGNNLTISNGVLSGVNSYTLPTSSTTVLGGFKVGANLSISNGVLAGAAPYSKPSAEPISYITGLQTALNAKTTPAYVDTQVAALVDSAPATLNTLNELAAALGDDANHTATMTALIGTKQSATADYDVGDNVKIKLGDDDDLQIYHDGVATSYIRSNADLYIQGTDDIILRDHSNNEEFIRCNKNDSVQISHDNSIKLATTSTGIDVTGSVTVSAGSKFTTASGNDLNIDAPSTRSIFFKIGGSQKVAIDNVGNVGIGTPNPSSILHAKGTSSITNNLINVINVESATTGTAANGVGTKMTFWGSMTGQGNVELGQIGFHNNNVSGAHGDFVVLTRPNGTSVERLRITSTGNVEMGGSCTAASFSGDGSNLTNAGIKHTLSASDPTVLSNPSAVGHLWINSASGEQYICTDATAGANVWINTGSGSGNVEPTPYAWHMPANSCASGTLSSNGTVWTANTGQTHGYSGVIINQTFPGDFEVIASWQHDYIGVGFVWATNASIDDYFNNGEDCQNAYFHGQSTSGFSGSNYGVWGQYHAPRHGDGASTDATKTYFRLSRTGNTLKRQWSEAGTNGPWTAFTYGETYTGISSADKVIIGFGEASGTENDPLRLLSVTT